MEQRKITSPEDWTPYLDKIRSLYLDEDRTLNDLREHMKTMFGVTATVNQYKKLFTRQKWSKNATRDQWANIGQAIAKRKRDGKETTVLFHGQIVDSKKLKRELDRYQADIEIASKTLHSTNDNIVLRTPSPQLPRTLPGSGPLPPSSNIILSPRSQILGPQIPSKQKSNLGLQVSASNVVSSPAPSVSFSLVHSSPQLPPYLDLGSILPSRCSTPSSSIILDCSVDDDLLLTCGFAFDALQDALLQTNISIAILELDSTGTTSTDLPGQGSYGIPATVIHSWSVESLRVLADEIIHAQNSILSSPLQHMTICIQSASLFQLLDVVVCAVVGSRTLLLFSNPTIWDVTYYYTWHQILAWFTHSRHFALLERLARAKTPLLQVFSMLILTEAIQSASRPHSSSVRLSRLGWDYPNRLQNTANQLLNAANQLLNAANRLDNIMRDDGRILDLDQKFFPAAIGVGRFDICEMLLRRGFWLSEAAAYDLICFAILATQPKELEFLLRFWKKTNSHLGKDLFGDSGCTKSFLGMALHRMIRHTKEVSARAQNFTTVIQILLDRFQYDGFQLTQPCWEDFNTLDLCALLDSPVSNQVAQLLRERGAREGAVAQIVEGAKKGHGHLRLAYVGLDETEAAYFLNISLWGAAYAGNQKLARALLLLGVQPDFAALSPRTNPRHTRFHHHFTAICLLEQLPIGNWRGSHQMACLLIEAGAVPLSQLVWKLQFSTGKSRQYYHAWLLKQDTLQSDPPQRLLGRYPRESLEIASSWADQELYFMVIDAISMANHPREKRRELEQLALYYSLSKFDLRTSQKLLDRGFRFYGSDAIGRCLLEACKNNSLSKIQFLLGLGASPDFLHLAPFANLPITTTIPPLQSVVYYAKQEAIARQIVECLLSAGADPNLGPTGGRRTLDIACRSSYPSIVRLLIHAGANLTAGNPILAAINFHKAFSTKHDNTESILSMLSAAYADQSIDIKPMATAALEEIADISYINAAIRLLKLGADVDGLGRCCDAFGERDKTCGFVNGYRNKRGTFCACATPVELAAVAGEFDMVKLLINAGAEGCSVVSDYDGLFQYPESVVHGDIKDASKIVDGLGHAAVQLGEGNRTVRDKRFRRALGLAQKQGHIHVVELLKRHQ